MSVLRRILESTRMAFQPSLGNIRSFLNSAVGKIMGSIVGRWLKIVVKLVVLGNTSSASFVRITRSSLPIAKPVWMYANKKTESHAASPYKTQKFLAAKLIIALSQTEVLLIHLSIMLQALQKKPSYSNNNNKKLIKYRKLLLIKSRISYWDIKVNVLRELR